MNFKLMLIFKLVHKFNLTKRKIERKYSSDFNLKAQFPVVDDFQLSKSLNISRRKDDKVGNIAMLGWNMAEMNVVFSYGGEIGQKIACRLTEFIFYANNFRLPMAFYPARQCYQRIISPSKTD